MADDALVSRVMLDAIEKNIVRQGSFFRDKFFGNINILPTTYVEYDEEEYNDGVLPFAGYDGESTTGALNPYDSKLVKVECIRHKHVIKPSDLDQRLPGHSVFDTEDKIAELQNLSYGELERALIRTEEFLVGLSLTKGKVDVVTREGETKNIINYWDTPVTGGANDPIVNVPAASKWTASTPVSTVLGDIMAWTNLILAKKGSAPRTLVLGTGIGSILSGILVNTPNSFVPNAGAGIDINANYDDEAVRYIGQFAGLDIYISGASVGGAPILGADEAILGSNGVNKMVYGATYLPLENNMVRVVGRRTMYTMVKKDPTSFANIIQSAPLPLVRRKWDNLFIKFL
jgi:hypothetical protein